MVRARRYSAVLVALILLGSVAGFGCVCFDPCLETLCTDLDSGDRVRVQTTAAHSALQASSCSTATLESSDPDSRADSSPNSRTPRPRVCGAEPGVAAVEATPSRYSGEGFRHLPEPADPLVGASRPSRLEIYGRTETEGPRRFTLHCALLI